MDKLYWIACDDKDASLFEGRYQGRTRGAALKFLKDQIGRQSLNGLVFTITEIPVPLIREIVAEILGGDLPVTLPPASPDSGCHADPADAAEAESEPLAKPTPVANNGKPGNPGFGDDLWIKARAFWEECRCVRKTAEKFGLSPNSVKTRARREGWRK